MGKQPVRVAIVGGGCAGLTTAFELTRPELEGAHTVTVYQMGFRLGGKGASGRGPAGRIEEHGLHLWMGYYENAFRLMRECYAELGRDRGTCPIATFSDAFKPDSFNVAADWSPSGRWLPWKVHFPAGVGLPGDPSARRFSVSDYLSRAAALVQTLFVAIRERTGVPAAAEPYRTELPLDDAKPDRLAEAVARLVRYGMLAGLTGAIEGLRLLGPVLGALPELPQALALGLVEGIDRAARSELERLIEEDDELRRLWEIADIVLAVIRGSLTFRLATDPRGFDAIDAYDSREWLKLNGASDRAVNSAFIRALYDLAFAYEGGDADRPRMSAGCALRGAFRAFFTYRGAFFWKMQAGMGDIVFAPLYEVLKRRGVRFEFFHRLQNLGLGRPDAGGRHHVRAIDFDIQARVLRGKEYQPLELHAGLPCWPSKPDRSQLETGSVPAGAAWDPESQGDPHSAGTRQLRVGRDFDLAVLAVGLGTLPYVSRELMEADERWRDMVRNLGSVPTQAFQLWLKPSMRDLGWTDGATNLSGFVEPFDTWADMTHLGGLEGWRERPGAIAYFCNALRDVPSGYERGTPAFVAAQHEIVRSNAVDFLNREIVHLWPKATDGAGLFRWSALMDPAARTGAGREDETCFASQYWTANVRASDRYSQALPGTAKYRISPLDPSYDNLAVAGDWTDCGLNMGCVEAAVMSGRLAAHALAQFPSLADIVGFDHP